MKAIKGKKRLERLSELRKSIREVRIWKQVEAIWLKESLGWSGKEVAMVLGDQIQTVYLLWHRWKREGIKRFEHQISPGGRRHASLSEEEEREWLNCLKGSSESGERVTVAHGQQTQQSLAVNQPIRLMFMDEARFGRISEIQACWALHGVRPRVFSQFVRTSLYVFAGVIPETGHLDALILPTVNLDSRSIFLQEVSLQHPHKHLVIILEQAGWHISPQLKLPPNLTLHFLPPYSPQLNPVEEQLERSSHHDEVS